jgi:GT2 family glycosyltransferase
LLPKSKLVSGYNLTHASIDEEMEIGACVGAFMFVSPACYAKIGLLDEQFFMYGEDLDWCKSASEAGFKIWYYPKAVCMHYKGQTSRKNPKKALYEFHNTMWQYYKKHLIHKYPAPLNWLVYVGIWSRYLLQLTKNMFRAEAVVSK